MYVFPEEFKKAYESSPLSFVYYQNIDGKAVPVLASEGFCRNTGMNREQVLSWLQMGMFERMHPDDVGLLSMVSDDFLNHRGVYDVAFRCRLGKEYVLIHGLGKWQTMPDGTRLAVIHYSNLTATLEQIGAAEVSYDIFREDRFYTDSLTGLPNINYLRDFTGEKMNIFRSEGKTPQLVYSDVCSMQSYNNQYGVREGDDLLRLVASSIREKFPKSLLVRGADDHFILITGIDDQKELKCLLGSVNEQIRKNAKGNTLGIRSGICTVEKEMDVMEALDHARHALKRIDNNMTRTVAFFSKEADDQYWKNRYIIENIDRALEQGWIKVFYQGIFRVESEKIAVFEALARWVDPSRGTISPAEFIPVLLHYHQLYKLDLFMLEQVCREIPVRYENGLPLVPVSVNFSGQDFDHVDVVEKMNELYEKYDLQRYVEKDFFIVEITEQDVAVGTETFGEQLKRIRENGYCLWLDDFGSGYSTISMFSHFQFDLIKYDMDLLRHLDENNGLNRLILKELVSVSKKLGIHTLIEGLETKEQLQFVRDIGCELVQGFYYYRPEPLDEILFRLRGGMKVKACETKEEREYFRKKWLCEEQAASQK